MRKELVINVIKAILSTISLLLIYDLPVTNIIVPLATFVLYFFYKNIEINRSKAIVICSTVLSFFIAFGKTLPFAEESGYGFVFWMKMIMLFAGFFVFFISFISKIIEIISKKKLNNKAKYSPKLIFIISFIVIILCWIPYIIAEYPSPFLPDTIAQFNQVLGITPYNNANPFIHTFYISILYSIVSTFVTNMNDKLFIMSIVQAVINAGVYALAISFFYKRIGRILYVVLSILFFGLIYYNAIYNITISKDTSFSIIIILLIISFIRYMENQTNINAVLLSISIILFGISRTNAYYALLFALIIELVLLVAKKCDKKLFFIVLASLIICTLIKGPIYSFIFDNLNKEVTMINSQPNEKTKDNIENSSVYSGNSFLGDILSKLPNVIQTQQIANVVYHNRELNEKEIWLIEEAAPIEVIKESYNPILVDDIYKAIEKNHKPTYEKIDVLEYYKLWLELLLKYPADYVEAYINMTRYYFYPNRVVRTASTKTWSNDFEIKKRPLVSAEYTEAIEDIENIQTKTPFIANLYSPAIAVFVLLIVIVYVVVSKEFDYLLPLLMILGIFLTLMISTPINDEFRYIYPIVNTMPIFITIPFISYIKEDDKL